MLHLVSVGVSDVERAAAFYDAVLGALGYKRIMEFMPYAVAYGEKNPEFWVQLPHDHNAATVGNGVHVGFAARTKAQVNKFHEAALAQGGSNNGEPGPRPDYGPTYYGAFVYDLDGNKLEATLTAPTKVAAKPKAKKVKAKAAKKPAKKVAKKAAPKKKAKRKAKK
jgi:catechol 2,3-dioxygenase-like lactoylglutathione lyase family enzyme